MSAFPRTLRWLRRDASERSLWMPLALALLLAAWLAWSFLARVTVYAVSDAARLEVATAAFPIESPVEGRVTATHVVLGAEVRAGDALLELDAEPLRLEMRELEAKREGGRAELAPLEAEVRALEEQIENVRQAQGVGSDELAARVREEEASLHLAEQVAKRNDDLHKNGFVSDLDLDKAQADVQVHAASVERAKSAKDRADWDRKVQASELRANLEETRHDASVVQRELSVAEASIERLAHEIERRTIRATADGRIGETASVRVGQVVAQGARLGAIVPAGDLRIVAALRPEDALGRVRPGQSARFRLHGFPWIQFGSIPARVASLASETLEGSARVELSVERAIDFPVALQHGLPGRLEIEIERVSPATLVLRSAGALLAGSTPTPASITEGSEAR